MKTIPNWIRNREVPARDGRTIEKHDPATGEVLSLVARSSADDTKDAIQAARDAFPDWSTRTPVERGEILRRVAQIMEERREEIASIVAKETGKSFNEGFGETGAAIEQGYFVAGEGRRFYGKTTTSAVPGKMAMVWRQPVGIAGLIIAANTPIANVAWKAFPAMLCGNGVIMKASEDTPETAFIFAQICKEAGVPDGVFNVIQGLGVEAGAPLVESPHVDLVSFTGSCGVGKWIAETAGKRLAKVCLELGGKNPLVVADDADLDKAVDGACSAAFSNAGQRCASGSRVIVFDAIYDAFMEKFTAATAKLKVGTSNDSYLGGVINERQLMNMIAAVQKSVAEGATLVVGGGRVTDPELAGGYFMQPTILADVDPEDEISRSEIFGPITCVYRVKGFDEAVAMANDSPFGLTSAIYTQDLDRAMVFVQRSSAGVAAVNHPTHGSEPHMPFGGLRNSGNGTREAGAEALDVYSELKTVYVNTDPARAASGGSN